MTKIQSIHALVSLFNKHLVQEIAAVQQQPTQGAPEAFHRESPPNAREPRGAQVLNSAWIERETHLRKETGVDER